MTGYVRKDTTNNIADGNVINAADLDAEFDGVKDAFQASTGHKHDGTTGEGAPITSLGPNQDVTISATLLAPKTTNTVDIGSSALKFKDLFLAGNGSVGGTLTVTGVSIFSAGSAAAPAITTTGDTNTGMFFPAADTIAFAEGGAEAMRLDASGNMGLGVTPSAWWSDSKAMQVGAGTVVQGRTGSASFAEIGANVYLDSSATAKYIATSTASRYQQAGGVHYWYTAPSGTAGNAITFTQAMTLDASGRLGIGTTSPSQLLDVRGTSSPTIKVRNDTATTDTYAQFLFEGVNTFSGTSTSYIRSITSNSGNSSTALTFGTNADGGGAAAERARIDSSGNLLVGTTSAGGQGGLTVYPNGSGTSVQLSFKKAADGVQNTVQVFFAGASQVGSVTYTNTATAFNTSSDYRLKNTIAPMTGALAKVALLKPCTYKWNADGSDGEGFIAHELAQVVPQCVTGEKDAVNEDGSIKPQGIDTSYLVATLTAAIQELKAEVDSLKAQINGASA